MADADVLMDTDLVEFVDGDVLVRQQATVDGPLLCNSSAEFVGQVVVRDQLDVRSAATFQAPVTVSDPEEPGHLIIEDSAGQLALSSSVMVGFL